MRVGMEAVVTEVAGVERAEVVRVVEEGSAEATMAAGLSRPRWHPLHANQLAPRPNH